MQTEDIMERYRHLRAIHTRHQTAALDYVSQTSIGEHFKQLGLTRGAGRHFVSEEEATLAMDMAVHTAKPGRSRAIDRYAKAAVPPPGTEDARVLDAIREARFSLWRVDGHHETAGLRVSDVVTGTSVWLIDQGLAASCAPGIVFASRLCDIGEFAITCGVIVPIGVALLAEIMMETTAWLEQIDVATAGHNLRLAATVYRHAIRAGVMDNVEFRAPQAA